MKAGHALLQAGHYLEAMHAFEAAAKLDLSITPTQHVQSLQMAGVAARMNGDIATADSFLHQASITARKIDDPFLLAHVLRDYGASGHVYWLQARKRPGAKESAVVRKYYEDAEQLLLESRALLLTLWHANDHNVSELVASQEYHATLGFLGSLHADNGDRRRGRMELRIADDAFRTLQGSDRHEVYELNTLLRLMRVEPLYLRPSLLGRALALTNKQSASPGQRSRVFGALLGNRFYTWMVMRSIS
jgi:hypothetical protein